MTLSEAFALTSFALFSLSDLRTRLVPGIEWFFAGAILLTLPASPVQTGLVVLATGWGLFRSGSGFLALPLLFYPTSVAGAADRLRPPARSGGESRPAGNRWPGLPAAPARRVALPVRLGSLAQALVAAQIRTHPGPARTASGLTRLSGLAPAPALATLSPLPPLQLNIMPLCRAPEPWANPSPTFTLAHMLACPSGAAA